MFVSTTQSEDGEQECQLRVAIACMLIGNGAYVDVENRKGRNPLLYGVPPVNEGVKRFIKHKRVSNTIRFKRTLIYYDIDNTVQIFSEIPFFGPQNDSETVKNNEK